LSGCGNGGFETESRLEISKVTPSVIQSDVVETTDDSGVDGEAGTNDEGEGDGRPQPLEEVTVPLEEDSILVTFTNTLREGSDSGVDIELYRYAITYYDENRFTPLFAPRTLHDMQLVVPSGSAGTDFEVIVVDVKMKVGWLENNQWIDGIRDIYLYDYGNFDSILFAQIDFFGRDPLNDEPTFTTGVVEIHFADYVE
jgi:hypothetical protein